MTPGNQAFKINGTFLRELIGSGFVQKFKK